VRKDFIFAEKVRILHGSVCDFTSTQTAMNGVDIVIHLAVNQKKTLYCSHN